MSEKRLCRAWVKGNKRHLSVYGAKDLFAYELIIFKDIKLSKKDLEFLDIRNNSVKELERITIKEASELLEKKRMGIYKNLGGVV